MRVLRSSISSLTRATARSVRSSAASSSVIPTMLIMRLRNMLPSIPVSLVVITAGCSPSGM